MSGIDSIGEVRPATALIDAHVHIHDCFGGEPFFDAAAANFGRAKDDLRASGDVYGFLLLSESAGVDRFAALAQGQLRTGSWQISHTEEAVSLVATRPGVLPMFVIAGCQIATAERLEVLALGTRERPPDGAPLRTTLAALAKTDALAVLPWGFGKWMGRRGRHVAELFDERAAAPLYAGDNGGRPQGFGRPKLLAFAEAHGKLVLPGTDPLPFPGEIMKPGRYGCVADLELDRARPFASLRRWLERQGRSPRRYGCLERPWTFLDRQMCLHWRNLTNRRKAQGVVAGRERAADPEG
jgi:hypothetical protein